MKIPGQTTHVTHHDPSSCIEEEIVLAGISGRFPESSNMSEFAENLLEGVDMVTDDGRRWSPGLYGLPTRSGKLKSLDKFDATFFAVHAKQANVMDPQLRILLELTHEALIDAGINPVTLRGTRTGVFIGASKSESGAIWSRNHDHITGYELTGTCGAMLANRISYEFDLKGPSFLVDTSCSSSFVAVHEAVEALKSGKIDGAVVGGVNLCLCPNTSLQFYRLGMLSQDGRCKSFDDGADGYVRSEAAVMIFLQRKENAVRSYATIVHTKTNCDGYKKEGVTFPSAQAQRGLLEEIYGEAGISPSEISYFEAHGTGTQAGDTQELNTITQLFCKDRPPSSPLMIGSVKTNMGHSEAASGLCSLAKVIIAIGHGLIPGNLNFTLPNSKVPALSDGRLKVITHNVQWDRGLVGINNFGFGGSNCHIILRPNVSRNQLTPAHSSSFSLPPPPPVCIFFSGRTEEAVKSALIQLSRPPHTPIGELERSAILHQLYRQKISGHPFQAYSLYDDGKMVAMELNQAKDPLLNDDDGPPPLWFVFSGMGSQCGRLGDLLAFKIFRDSITQSAAVLRPKGIELFDLIQKQEPTKNVLLAFVTITAVQVALLEMLTAVGLTPNGFFGHSVGELACAFCDGCLSPEETLLAAYARGQAILNSNLPLGGMASVGLSWENAIARCPPELYVACHNSVDNVTVGGPDDNVRKFVEDLEGEGHFAKMVDSCGQAFHTPYIQSAGPKLGKYLEKIIPNPPKPRSPTWISSSIPESQWQSTLAKTSSVDYHVNNLMSPVLFHGAVGHVPPTAIVVEIAPHSIFQSVLKRALPTSCHSVGLLKKNLKDKSSIQFLACIGKLYNLRVVVPNLSNLYGKVDFPVSSGAGFLSPLIQWDHSCSWNVARFAEKMDTPSLETAIKISLKDPQQKFYSEYVMDGQPIFPAFGQIVLVWRRLAQLSGKRMEEHGVTFEDVIFHKMTPLPPTPNDDNDADDDVNFNINILRGTGQFQVLDDQGELTCSGIVRDFHYPIIDDDETPINDPPIVDLKKHLTLTKEEVYKELNLRGYNYKGAEFMGTELMDCCHDEEGHHWAKLRWTGNWVTFLDTMSHSLILSQNDSRLLRLPSGIQMLSIEPKHFLTHHEKKGVVHLKIFNDLKTIKCTGIQCYGLLLSPVPKRGDQIKSKPKIESYAFTPYIDEDEKHMGVTRSRQTALHILVQLVYENCGSLNPKILEILPATYDQLGSGCLSDDPKFGHLESLIRDIILEEPNWDCKIDSRHSIPLNTIQDDKLTPPPTLDKPPAGAGARPSPQSFYHLVIAHESIGLEEALESLSPQGFVLLCLQRSMSDDPAGTLAKMTRSSLCLVADKIYNDQSHLLLFRKCPPAAVKLDPDLVINPSKIIKVTNHNYDWVTQLKEAMIQVTAIGCDVDDNPSKKIYLTSTTTNTPNSGIIGFTNSLRLEPGGLFLRAYFVTQTDSSDLELDFMQPDPHLRNRLLLDLVMNIYKGGVWGSYRRYPLETTVTSTVKCNLDDDHAYINVLSKGDLSSVSWVRGGPPLARNEGDYCRVHYASINFRDVMLATDKLKFGKILASSEGVYGTEFSGIDLTTGYNRVMGLVGSSALATLVHPTDPPDYVWKVPDDWTLADASTVPLAYALAYYALIIRGQLKEGESILIHSGASVVGQAAIAIALSMKCTVWVTVGSEKEEKFLKKIFPTIKKIFFDTSFHSHIIKLGGIDLVLQNCLSRQNFLEASIRCLGEYGRFIEVGEIDLTPRRRMVPAFLKNITFHRVLLDDIIFCAKKCGRVNDKFELAKLLADGIVSGIVGPLPATVFGHQEIESGFRYAADDAQVGKVLIRLHHEIPWGSLEGPTTMDVIHRTFFDPNKSYLVVGGFGGFGIVSFHPMVHLKIPKTIEPLGAESTLAVYETKGATVLSPPRGSIIIMNRNSSAG